MGKLTISMAIFNSKLLVYQAGYAKKMEVVVEIHDETMGKSENPWENHWDTHEKDMF